MPFFVCFSADMHALVFECSQVVSTQDLVLDWLSVEALTAVRLQTTALRRMRTGASGSTAMCSAF